MKESGSGESLSRIPMKVRTQLVNMEVGIEEATALINLFRIVNKFNGPILLEFAKEGKRTFGTAWEKEKRIRLNRRCIGTLIHEVAHIFCPEKGHGWLFAKQLDQLYFVYLNYLKTKRDSQQPSPLLSD